MKKPASAVGRVAHAVFFRLPGKLQIRLLGGRVRSDAERARVLEDALGEVLLHLPFDHPAAQAAVRGLQNSQPADYSQQAKAHP